MTIRSPPAIRSRCPEGSPVPDVMPTTPADALVRMTQAENTLRAIGEHDQAYRTLVENMRDGAATLSSGGLILYANRRLAELLSCSRDAIVGSPLARFLSGGLPIDLEKMRGPAGVSAVVELDLVDGNGRAVPVRIGTSALAVDGEQL